MAKNKLTKRNIIEQMQFRDQSRPDPGIPANLANRETSFSHVDFPNAPEGYSNYEEFLASQEYKKSLIRLEKLTGKTYDGSFVADNISDNIKRHKEQALLDEYKLRKEIAEKNYDIKKAKKYSIDKLDELQKDRDFKYNKLRSNNFFQYVKILGNILNGFGRIITKFSIFFGFCLNKFRDFINLEGLNDNNKSLIYSLFSSNNLDSNMRVGFKGNPNIGSVVLNKFKDSNFPNDQILYLLI